MFRPFCAILLFFGVLGLFPAAANAQHPTLSERMQASAHSRPMPDFLIDDGQGRQLTIGDFRGRYVLMNFWATWCGPCVEEMPSLDKLAGEMNPKDLQIVAVNENSHGMDIVTGFLAQHNLKNLDAYMDASGRALSLLRIRAVPTTVLIDRNGNEIARIEGNADWSAPDIVGYLRKLTMK